MKSDKRKIGDQGEELACCFLKKQGLVIKERNYLKKWGEIDIVAYKQKGFLSPVLEKIHFVEVKTVSCETKEGSIEKIIDDYLLSNNVHRWKIERLSRVFMTYLAEKKVSDETLWQFDIIVVFLGIKDISFLKDKSIKDTTFIKDKNCAIKYFENVII